MFLILSFSAFSTYFPASVFNALFTDKSKSSEYSYLVSLVADRAAVINSKAYLCESLALPPKSTT
jgi:hypothetical protein